jgi:hypothetical protein
MTGNHHLARRIKINRGNDLPRCGGTADFRNRRITQAENRRHCTTARRYGILHAVATGSNQTDGFRVIQCAGTNQCRVFSQAVPGHQRRHGPTLLLPDPPDRHTGCKHGRLCPVGLAQIFSWPVPDQFPQVIPENVTGLLESLRYLMEGRSQSGQHTHGLGPLSGKHHGNCRVTAIN